MDWYTLPGKIKIKTNFTFSYYILKYKINDKKYNNIDI